MSRTVTTRLDDESVAKIDELAAKRGVDRAALLRSLFLRALDEQLLFDCLEQYQSGKITLWEGAKRCNRTLWEMIQEVKKMHTHAPYDLEALQEDIRWAIKDAPNG